MDSVRADLKAAGLPVREHRVRTTKHTNHRPGFGVDLRDRAALVRLLEQVLPFLRLKKRQGQLLKEFCRFGKIRPTKARFQDYTERQYEIADQIRQLNLKGGGTLRSVQDMRQEAAALNARHGQYRTKPTMGNVSSEGVETKQVSPNNNPAHERPAPALAG